ncbi:copper homeostasis periplasmic binding protein CopC [Bordetella sp. FB-8]|uniref:copper homeostasis periplasmic binding protein CopC n=1 Tax=Bordetella sp. FB-8 TaxID=1159870 RepID=UPI0012DC861F|nr:copper homeostasis periplasmic binding protein CopC [Bordetella sp. FB-8]
MKKVLLACAAALLLPQPAWAHAHLKQASPANGSTVASPPEIRGDYTEGLNIAFSSMTLAGADGKMLNLGKAALVAGDDKAMDLAVNHPLPSGHYIVTWHALSKDGHKTQGTWNFTIK